MPSPSRTYAARVQPTSGVRAALDLVADVPGWLSEDQAGVLHSAVSALPAGSTVVEIGSHHGRSTVVLAHALPPAGRLVAVDPFPARWRYGAPGTEATCRANLVRAGLADRVDLRVSTSRDARRAWTGPVHLLFVDGKHDAASLVDDLRWTRACPAGATVAVHDAYSSVGVTIGLLGVLLTTRRLRFTGRTGSLAVLCVAPPVARDRIRALVPVPWWLRNLAVKLTLRLHVRPVARLLGHHGTDDPY